MSTCPAGSICFNKETFFIIIFLIGALIVMGYNKNPHLVNFTEPLRDFFPNDNKEMQSNPGAPIEVNIPKPVNQSIQVNSVQENTGPILEIQVPPQTITEPRREIPTLGTPINIPTRGFVPKWNQVGILHSLNRNREQNHILQLFGKQTYPGSSKWNYFASSDGYQSIKLPIIYKGKKATYEYGCEELTEGDIVRVPAYGQRFRVNLYELNTPSYIPYL